MSQRQDLVEQFFRLYKNIGQLMVKELHEAFDGQLNYPMAAVAVLKTVAHQGPCSQHSLATAMHYSDAAVSRQIGVLLKDGWVTSTPDPDNRRETIIGLTDQGKQILAEVDARFIKHFSCLLEPVSDQKLTHLIKENQELYDLLAAQQGKENKEV